MTEAQVSAAAAAVFAVAFAACATLLARGRAPRVLVAGHAAVAVLLAGTAAAVLPAPRLSLVLATSAALVVVPLLLLLHPDGALAPQVGAVAAGVVVATGVLAVLYPSLFVTSGLAGLVQFLVVVVASWWRFERATGPGAERTRQAVLWGALVLGTGLLVAGHLTFLVPTPTGFALMALVLLPAPFALVVGTRWPDVADVRGVIARGVVEAAALVIVVAVYVGVASGLEVVRGSAPEVGEAAVVAALAALLLQPARVALRGVVDRLVFGDRENPVRAASHVGATLGDDPVLALRALREALDVPHAALHARGRVVASSGVASTAVHRQDLLAGDTSVGRLDVGLRPGQVRLRAQDRTTLDVLAPALAQALLARALTEQLQESRAGVIAAVEDERRRLRRDLHDGLGPTLTGIAFAADAARNTQASDPVRSHELLTALRRDAADAIVEVRRLVEGLRPPAVDELGLVGALRQQVRALHAADGRRLDVHVDAPVLPPLPAAVEVAAYRIVTEALTNVARHAGCHDATVRLSQVDGGLCVEVVDAGTGSAAPTADGVGLGSMRERAEQVGGSFACTPGPGGTRVHAVLPL
ncbi:MAG: sensor histidine kinase [Nocardioidaceae bacterium]|nr:sensor histidine kinase [Nocardioidaceae bacterium]